MKIKLTPDEKYPIPCKTEDYANLKDLIYRVYFRMIKLFFTPKNSYNNTIIYDN